MKKRILSIILIIFCLCSYGCTDTQKITYVEYVSSVIPPYGPYGNEVTYHYHYWGNEIVDNAPDTDSNSLLTKSNYSITILEYGTPRTAAKIEEFVNSNNIDNNYKNGFILSIRVYYLNTDKVRISIKFQEIEIYNGIVYKNKTDHNNAHQPKKDD